MGPRTSKDRVFFVIFDLFVAFVFSGFLGYNSTFQGSGDFTDLMGRSVFP